MFIIGYLLVPPTGMAGLVAATEEAEAINHRVRPGALYGSPVPFVWFRSRFSCSMRMLI